LLKLIKYILHAQDTINTSHIQHDPAPPQQAKYFKIFQSCLHENISYTQL